MELRILNLDIYVDDTCIKIKNGDLEIRWSPFCNNYDLLIINFIDNISYKDFISITNFLTNQGYYRFYNCNSKDLYMTTNTLKLLYDYNDFNSYADFNTIYSGTLFYDFFQNKLPCLFRPSLSHIKYLDDNYKITKIDIFDMYYIEQKGQLTKAAVKKTK
ncbi:hypothetical protein Hokovirus_2_30 [Hokovirus HKV1]|mgnify:CR=1 FL=1|uniref:Uncharacterized protein n=1 Tax=Hokovirus HKV1 TaxID=1977638 RepID=A0A1V0SFL7_9VIRU|nr:hypothetical protein Hokovirus_2_30 [Hokovirus HKV1]